MNNFRIYFKEVTVLDIEGSKKTFAKGKSYGFKFMSDKVTKSIRKQVMKNPNMVFTLTDDTTGCLNIVYGNRKPKDITVTNLVTMNKGKKNKKALADKIKASLPKVESDIDLSNPVSQGENDGIMESDNEEDKSNE